MVDHGLYMVISWSTMFLKHGRPCLKHGRPCFDRVHFTGVLTLQSWTPEGGQPLLPLLKVFGRTQSQGWNQFTLTHVFPGFLKQELHKNIISSNWLLFHVDNKPIDGKQLNCLSWRLLSNVWKNIGWARVQTHKPWTVILLPTELPGLGLCKCKNSYRKISKSSW